MSLAVACGVAFCLTACSGTATPQPTSAPAVGISVVASTAVVASAAPATSSATVSAKALCDYLRGQIPTLEGIGSKIGAMANLTVNLSTWYDKQGAIPNGGELDEQTQSQCPDVRTEVLELAGIQSFAAL
jgi:hypothetical protein